MGLTEEEYTEEEYIDFIVAVLKKLPKEIIIHRLTGEGPSKDLIAPKWALEKRNILAEIEKLL